MDDPVDTVAPWTIKAVPTDTRNKVIVAARKEGLTVGQWLERRVNEWLEDGSPVPQMNGSPASSSIEDLCRLTEAAAKLAASRKDKHLPNNLAGLLSRRLREALTTPEELARPRPQPAHLKPKQIAGPQVPDAAA
jgi:hypothetical protein